MDVYEPREDSFALAELVKQLARGRVLDMGTGTGILAKAAKEGSATSVTGADLNPAAIAHCEKDPTLKGIKFVLTNLFESVDDMYDTIIFNPPYLPAEAPPDIALDGGTNGYEVMVRFIEQCGPHLSDDGQVLFLISTRTGRGKVEQSLADYMFSFSVIKEMPLDFERLLVYRAVRSGMYKELRAKGVSDIRYFAHGKRGVIFTGTYKAMRVAIKTKRAESGAFGAVENEIRMLRKVNEAGIGPKLLFPGEGYLCYIFVEGEPVLDYLSKAKQPFPVLEALLEQCRVLDSMGIAKEEMHHPQKHVLVSESGPVLIDFERGRFTEKPQNVTQLCQFLSGVHVRQATRKKLSRLKLSKLARLYSNDPACFGKIVEYVERVFGNGH